LTTVETLCELELDVVALSVCELETEDSVVAELIISKIVLLSKFAVLAIYTQTHKNTYQN